MNRLLTRTTARAHRDAFYRLDQAANEAVTRFPAWWGGRVHGVEMKARAFIAAAGTSAGLDVKRRVGIVHDCARTLARNARIDATLVQLIEGISEPGGLREALVETTLCLSEEKEVAYRDIVQQYGINPDELRTYFAA